MDTQQRHNHWQTVFSTKGERDVSWFQERPDVSLDMIAAAGVGRDSSIVDIGGGASRLVDALLAQGFERVTVLDVSEAALAAARARLGVRASEAQWIAMDVTRWQPARSYDLWHDRAAFHFLTAAEERAAYVERVRQAVRPGGHVIIATFALDGPERCSGLPVMRHDAASIDTALGPRFTLIDNRRHDHRTPGGAIQRFQFSRFQRAAT